MFRLMLVLLALPACFPALAGGGTFSGTVTTEGGATPVADATVALYRDAGDAFERIAEVATDASGAFAFAGVADGSYKLASYNAQGLIDEIAGTPNFSCELAACEQSVATEGATFPVTSGSGSYVLDFDLDPGDSVRGQVSNGTSPAVGVTVCLYDEDFFGGEEVFPVRFCAETDAAGFYRTPGFTGHGTLRIAAVATPPTGPERFLVPEVFDGGSGTPYTGENIAAASRVPVAGGRTQDFVLATGGVLAGTFEDETTAASVADVFVRILDAQGVLVYASGPGDELGAGGYLTGAMPPGIYFVFGGQRDGGDPPYTSNVFDGATGSYCTGERCAERAVAFGTPVAIAAGEETAADFFLEAGVLLSGTVFDAAAVKAGRKGLPGVEDATVCAFDDAGEALDACATSDASGAYTLPLLPPIDVRLLSETSGTSDAYIPEAFGGAVALPPDPLASSVVDLSGGDVSGIDFLLATGGRFLGKVRDEQTNAVLLRYAVEVYGTGGALLTRARGRERVLDSPGYATVGLPPGDYRVVVRALPGEPYVDEVYALADDVLCQPLGGCDPLAGDPLVVDPGNNVLNLDLTSGGVLTGRVDDARAPGVGLPGAEVEIYDSGDALVTTVLTEGGGGFTASLLPGTYFLQTDVAGYVNQVYDAQPCATVSCGTFPPAGTSPDGVVLTAGQTAALNDFLLVPTAFDLAGSVLDEPGDGPIPGAEVCLFDVDGLPVGACILTGGAGGYGFEALPAGTYFVSASAAGFDGEAWDDVACAAPCDPIAAGATPIVLGVGTPSIDFRLGEETFTLSGSVRAEPFVFARRGGKGLDPIEGAEVCVFDADGAAVGACALTDSEGAYAQGGLLAGAYHVRVTAEGFRGELFDEVPCEPGCDPLTGTLFDLTADATLDFELAPESYRITGTLTDAEALAPLAGAEICFFDAQGEPIGPCVASAGDGTYDSGPRPAGTYLLRATAPGYVGQLLGGTPCPEGCDVTAGSTLLLAMDATGVDFALAPVGSEPTGRITGRIVLAGTDAPVGSLPVVILDGAGLEVAVGESDGTGRYVVEGLPDGSYFAFVDGTTRGFFSTVYAGAGEEGIPCEVDTCVSAALASGAPITVVAGASTLDVDFAVQGGGVLPLDITVADLDQVGAAVALCGARIAIGMPGDDEAGENAGALLVYERRGSGYVFVEKQLPLSDDPDGVAGLQYGTSLGCSGDTLVVGAPGGGGLAKGGGLLGKPSAFVLQVGGSGNYQQVQQLIAANLGVGGGGQSQFGASVAVSGDTMAIGAPGATTAMVLTPTGQGAFVWESASMLSDPEAGPGSGFGSAVAVGDDGLVAVGAPSQAGSNGLTSGVAQMFDNIAGSNRWESAGKITNPGGAAGDGFGTSLDLDGNTLAVGAPGDDTAGEDAGSASVFSFTGGGFVQLGDKIVPGDLSGGERFGRAVALLRGRLAVGAPFGTGVAPDTGAAYVFEQGPGNQFSPLARFFAVNGQAGDRFGASVAIGNGTIVVGAPAGRLGGIESGRATAFTDGDGLFRGDFEP